MRLADFIRGNIEAILVEWENHARNIWPEGAATPDELRDHAEDMLLSVANEMASPQRADQQREKSWGRGEDQEESRRVDRASRDHAQSRSASGFDLRQLVAEYRALRASVIRLWLESHPEPHPRDLEDVIRFGEAIDQLLTESVYAHTEQLNRSRDLFLAILGHDLRNPLSAIVGLAGLLRYENLPPSSLELVSQFKTHTDSMVKLIEDLLEFAAIRIAGSFKVLPALMDLLPVSREVLAEMKSIYPNRDFRFEHHGNLEGEWDEPRLKQLISNLLGNAAQHGAGDRPIEITLEASDDAVVLRIRNRGRPIPADQLQTLFEPMKRYRAGEGRSSHGSVGLGLYIAHEIAVAHGGTIEARSDKQGTVIAVRLPRVFRGARAAGG